MSRLVRAPTPFPLTTAGYIQYASQSVYANRSLGNPFRHVEIFLADTQKKNEKRNTNKRKRYNTLYKPLPDRNCLIMFLTLLVIVVIAVQVARSTAKLSPKATRLSPRSTTAAWSASAARTS